MLPELRRLVETSLILTPELEERSQAIVSAVLNSSRHIDDPNRRRRRRVLDREDQCLHHLAQRDEAQTTRTIAEPRHP